jgi:hypothetical protein
MIGLDFDLEPKEQVEYLKSKGYRLSYHYKEMMHSAHHSAFAVAKVTSLDLLYDIRQSITDAQERGLGFTDWLNSGIKETLQKHGWYGKTEVTDPRTGEVKQIKVNARRLKTIYATNDRVAYMVARYKELMEDDLAPYWVYKSALLENTRASHAAMHNHVYHRDSPFWDTWYPPNAWNCQCYVEALSERQAKSGGFKLNKPFQPNGDQDWSYKVGATDQIAGVVDSAYSKTIKALRGVQLGEWGKTWQYDHVKQVLEAARQTIDVADYEAWASKFYDDKGKRVYINPRTNKELYDAVKAVGVMDIRVFDYFDGKEKTPPSAIISINGRQFLHATRDDKVSELNKKRMLNIPKMLANPSAILWDNVERNVLYISDMGDKGRKIKLAMCVKYMFKEKDPRDGKYNMILTGSRVPVGNLKEKDRYDLISGSLD